MFKYILVMLLTFGVFAKVVPTTPSMTLTDSNGVPIEGVTDSISIHNAMSKADELPNGTYLLKRPDVVFVVTNNLPIINNAIAFEGLFVVDDANGHYVDYSWKQISGDPITLIPSEGAMEFNFTFELPKGLRFNILAVEDK